MGQWTLRIVFSVGTGGGADSAQRFHVGSGYGLAGRIDAAVRRDGNGLPFVPGSAVKGKLRHAAREVASSLGIYICDNDDCLPGTQGGACAVCRIFGSVFTPGLLFASDARGSHQDNPRDCPRGNRKTYRESGRNVTGWRWTGARARQPADCCSGWRPLRRG
jgi:hypothetical protein